MYHGRGSELAVLELLMCVRLGFGMWMGEAVRVVEAARLGVAAGGRGGNSSSCIPGRRLGTQIMTEPCCGRSEGVASTKMFTYQSCLVGAEDEPSFYHSMHQQRMLTESVGGGECEGGCDKIWREKLVLNIQQLKVMGMSP